MKDNARRLVLVLAICGVGLGEAWPVSGGPDTCAEASTAGKDTSLFSANAASVEPSPREVIVGYEPVSLGESEPHGGEIIGEYERLISAIESQAGISVESFRATHRFLVSRMLQRRKTEDEVRRQMIDERRRKQGGYSEGASRYDFARSVVISPEDTGEDITDVADRLRNSTELITASGFRIVSVEINGLMATHVVPNDPLYSDQWAHRVTLAEGGWDIETGDTTVTIGIIDTGVDLDHEDLTDNLTAGYDFVDIDTTAYKHSGYTLLEGEDYVEPDGIPSDYYGHGTHCAGIAGAVGDNGIGVAGVCHQCTLLPVRAGFGIIHPTYGEVGLLEHDDIVNAIDYAVLQGADVISMSFGGSHSQEIDDALANAYGLGIVLVASAGNGNSDNLVYPGALDHVISVSASARRDLRAGFSSFGFWVDVAAPGVDVLSTVPTTGGILCDPSGYAEHSGTSMAAPYVAGLAGLLLATDRAWEPEDVRWILRHTADDLAESSRYMGSGRVNNLEALLLDEIPELSCSISSPSNDDVMSHDIEVTGTASGDDYVLSYGKGPYPDEWIQIASGGNVRDGVLGNLPVSSFVNGDQYTLRLVSWNSLAEVESRATFYYLAGMQEGWPRKLDFNFWTPAVVGDLEDDGLMEVLCTAGHSDQTHNPESLYVWNCLGEVVEGWPKHISSGAPSLADLDDDGDLEVVAQGMSSHSKVYIWHHDGSAFSPNWPQSVQTSFQAKASPAIGDVDGDGSLEIVTVFNHWGDPYPTMETVLYCWELDGSLADGEWPVVLSVAEQTYAWATPSLGDIDRDGDLDIVQLVTDWSGSLELHVLDEGGSYLPGWPLIYEDKRIAFSAPALADLDGNGRIEIVLPSTWPALLYVFDSEGNDYNENWPKSLPGSVGPSPAIADVDGDGDLEIIIIRNDSMVYVLQHDTAADLPGWPQRVGNWTMFYFHVSPLVADIDGDDRPEVIAASSTKEGEEHAKAYAFHWDGSLVSGWPKMMLGDFLLVNSTGAVADLDSDGDAELVVAAPDGRIYAWDQEGTYNPDLQEWPQYQCDPQHTGLYLSASLTAVGEKPLRPFVFGLQQNYPNPFCALTTINFTIPTKSQVSLAVFDAAGRLVRTLVDDSLPPGEHSVAWHGRDNSGRKAASGVYFAVLKSDGKETGRTLVLLK